MSSEGSQLMLFVTEHEKHADGSFTLRPTAVRDDREIDVEEAMRILRFRDRETIYGMLDREEILGWKPATTRGNGKWRIYWTSVMEYKQRREKAARSGRA